MYYNYDKFRKMMDEKIRANNIPGGDATKEEIDNLYKLWLIYPCTSFKDFFNQFYIDTADNFFDNYDIPNEMFWEFSNAEIIEWLAKEEGELAGAFQLSEDLWAFRG